jgi:intein/homing endonuclease
MYKSNNHRSKYSYNIEIFEKSDPIAYYILGVIATDGALFESSRYRMFKIDSKDKDWLESIRDIIVPGKPLYEYKNKNLYTLSIYCRPIFDWVKSNGMTPNKTLTLKMPRINHFYYRDFLRGVIDGDGSVSLCKMNGYDSVYMKIITASEVFANELNFILSELFEKPTAFTEIRHSKLAKPSSPTTRAFRVQYGGRRAVKFLDGIYYDHKLLKLERKFQNYMKIKQIFVDTDRRYD